MVGRVTGRPRGPARVRRSPTTTVLDASTSLEREVMMAGQDQIRHRRDDEPDDAPEPVAAPAAQARDAEVDSLLEEIDEVLEQNAESFVRGFVQKGGQ